MAHILVVEDDKSLNKSICLFLQQRGFIPQACFDGEEAFQLLYKHSFDIILCDIMMPVVDGFQLINHVRQLNKEIPIIMMTAKEDFQSKATLFNSGVDDYMVKPLNLQELELRIRALLRRANINVEKKLVVGNCTLDLEEHSVYVEDEPVKFTTREFDILLKFLTYPKKTFSRPQLMNEFWNPDNFTGTRTVDVYITKIREKLSRCTGFEIQTVHGLGYKAVIHQQEESHE